MYKVFYAKEFNVPLDKIEVEFIILKRKHDPDDVWSGDRIQRFVPAHGSMSSKEAWTSFNTFLNESFTKSGEYNMDYSFPKTPGNSLTMLSARIAAGSSPPVNTKSPIEISLVTR